MARILRGEMPRNLVNRDLLAQSRQRESRIAKDAEDAKNAELTMREVVEPR
jgi:hypothetical protein